MCGILGFAIDKNNQDKDFTASFLTELIINLETRGRDGVGIVILNEGKKPLIFKSSKIASELDHEIEQFIEKNLTDTTVLLAYTRNAPETEAMVDDNNLEKTLQPIIFNDIVLVHNGAITSGEVNKYRNKYNFKTLIDSETIIHAIRDKNYDIVKAFEDISGGWATIFYYNNALYSVSNHLPLCYSHIKDFGYITYSDYEFLHYIISDAVKFDTDELDDPVQINTKHEIFINEVDTTEIVMYDMNNQQISKEKYNVKYYHPTWKPDNYYGTKVLVMASSGIDSTATMVALKENGFDIIALHYLYPQRSRDAELIAIKKITEKLNVPLYVIDLQPIFEYANKSALMINKELDASTGTKDNAKSSIAWVPGRNMLFLTVAATIAEDLILSNQASQVYIAGGFPNISEESIYPDNGGVFVERWQKTANVSYLAGLRNRIKYISVMEGLTKKEELAILKYYGYEELYGLTISCYRAKVIDGEVYQCAKDGIPACSSGKYSYFASQLIKIKDNRKYYEIEDDNYDHYIPGWIEPLTDEDIKKIAQEAHRKLKLPK